MSYTQNFQVKYGEFKQEITLSETQTTRDSKVMNAGEDFTRTRLDNIYLLTKYNNNYNLSIKFTSKIIIIFSTFFISFELLAQNMDT